jgi:hypothetical protein
VNACPVRGGGAGMFVELMKISISMFGGERNTHSSTHRSGAYFTVVRTLTEICIRPERHHSLCTIRNPGYG